MKHVKQIDGLRAIAVASVIANHLFPSFLPGGYLGVDLFFVISGYVISLSLLRSDEPGSFRRIFKFYFKRIFRIIPVLSVVVLVFSLLICALSSKPLESLLTGGWSLVGLSNIYLAKASSSYFAGSSLLNPFVHTWSLGVEEQFYFFFPFLLLVCGVLSPGNHERSGFRFCALVLLGASCLSLILAAFKGQVVSVSNFYLPQYRFWEIALGASLLFWVRGCCGIRSNLIVKTVFSFVGLLGVFLALFIPYEFSFVGSIVMVLSALLLIYSFDAFVPVDRFLSSRVFSKVSERSYSLYLWHWPLISIAFIAYGSSLPVALVVLALTVFFSCVSYSVIERPAILYSREVVDRFKGESFWVFLPGLMFSTLVAVLGFAALVMRALPDVSLNIYSRFNGLSFAQVETKNDPLILFRMGSYWKDSDDAEVRRIASCFFEAEFNVGDVDRCLAPVDGSRKAAFLIGDSHAANYSFGIKKALGDDYEFRHFTLGMCGFVDPLDADLFSGRERSCRDYSNILTRHFVGALGGGDIVFLSMTWNDDPFYAKSSKSNMPLSTFAAIGRLAEVISSRGARLILLDDVPGYGDPSVCGYRWYRPWDRDGCSASFEDIRSSRSQYYNGVQDLTRKYPSVSGLSVSQIFCHEGLCAVSKNGVPLYVDQGHLNPSASRMIVDVVADHISLGSQGR